MKTYGISFLLLTVTAQAQVPSMAEVQKSLKENGATVKEVCLYRILLHDKSSAFTTKGDFGVTIESSWKGGKEKLALLKGQPKLKEVNFGDAPDEWLDILDDLQQLEGIYFSDAKRTTDKALERLKQYENLIALSFAETSITDQTLSNIAHLKKLRYLNICLTNVTDDGFKYLAGLENLEVLNVEGTKITDTGLMHLKGLKKLRKLRTANGILEKDM
jgi:hypothetical protein